MTYDCLLEREAWLGGGIPWAGVLRRGDAAPYIYIYIYICIYMYVYLTVKEVLAHKSASGFGILDSSFYQVGSSSW